MPSVKATSPSLDLTADLHKWRAFIAIAELGSITRAALHLDQDQSVLSRRINALERECNARLFNRTGRGVHLSEVGQRLFPLVRTLLDDAERLELEVNGQAREPAGEVRLGLLPSTAHPMIRRLFSRLRKQFPKVHLRIFEGSSGQIEEWLTDSRVDIAILYRYAEKCPPGETALAYVDSYLIGAANDPLTQSGEIDFDALDGLPFILPGAPNGLRNTLDGLARARKITISPLIEADSLPLMKSIVEHEKMYTVLPLHAVWQEVHEGRLSVAALRNPTMGRIISMAYARSKGPGRTVKEVADQIEALVREIGDEGIWHASPQADVPPGPA
ncbi:LysR family transcriptional regulator [Bordetella genomosp. 4]|uniref:LysR family transcriptional regulator n=1 Tax=Bordetella genomosp. 4 TaxID=463044 RepID=A0A261U600_9BORD|nr:LysR family transcriptional regulator [Bordetella genomosp. 4]OZI48680.1 LysR family transcriptional regulator [Bordetella genomosp. 4]OZI56680.1 LysR family transcriptional regulator [Bordetella genomosp. 4]